MKTIIQKMIAVGCVAGTLGGVAMMGGAIKTNDKVLLTEKGKNEILKPDVILQAEMQYKQAQIDKIIQDCKNGLITYDVAKIKCQDNNLSQLDIDEYAKENLSKEDYEKYTALKEDGESLEAITMFLFLGGGIATIGCASYGAKIIGKELIKPKSKIEIAPEE